MMELLICALVALATLMLLARSACREAPQRPPSERPSHDDSFV